MTNILQEYEQNMTRIRQECDRCLLPYADAGPRGSAWPSELGGLKALNLLMTLGDWDRVEWQAIGIGL